MADGKFYLGKITPEIKEKYSYENEDLTTHAVVFGMTGSGKTGLCIDMLEEAIDEDIPITIIDPKGDVANLSLLFPDLLPSDFKPWISIIEAKKAGLSIEKYSERTSEIWKKGLNDWGITGERMKRIKEKMDLRIFTPGSSAGLNVSILEGFNKPDIPFIEDEEQNILKIKNSVSALLSLLDIESDPLKSKPHILISNIIEHFWRNDTSLSIEDLILNIQKPPIKKLGVFDINRVIDSKERVELAFKINNIIASPGFRFWKSGIPLSAEELYRKKGDKIPVNIFYTSHLPENEKMFFTSLLLNEIAFWIKQQPGTPDLKYILYMDEIYGYLPPYPKNPPSKDPMMTLMKQARAFGLGVILVTQNSKDIDYKALTNTGTWFIGKLQAEGDIERVMEGVEGIIDEKGETLKSSELKKKISNLKKREFLVKNIHKPGILTFRTRWAMSYLRGPLTIEQIKTVTKDKKKDTEQPETYRKKKVYNGLLKNPPTPGIAVEYLYELSDKTTGKKYSPYMYLTGEIIFDENKIGLFVRKPFTAITPLKEIPDRDKIELSDSIVEYQKNYADTVNGFEPLNFKLNISGMKKMKVFVRDYIYSSGSIKLYRNKKLNTVSSEGEDEERFRLKCREIVEKMIDKEIDKKKDTYEKKIGRLEDRIEREKLKLERLEDEHDSRKTEEIVSLGETVIGFLFGSRSRRGLSAAARRRRMTSSAKDRVEMGKIKLSQFHEELKNLQEDLENEIADIEDKFYDKADDIEQFEVRLEKEDIIISKQAILWRLV